MLSPIVILQSWKNPQISYYEGLAWHCVKCVSHSKMFNNTDKYFLNNCTSQWENNFYSKSSLFPFNVGTRRISDVSVRITKKRIIGRMQIWNGIDTLFAYHYHMYCAMYMIIVYIHRKWKSKSWLKRTNFIEQTRTLCLDVEILWQSQNKTAKLRNKSQHLF